MIKWLMEPFDDKLNEIKTTLGDIQEVTEYLLGRMKEKTLAELKFEGRDDLTRLLVELKDKINKLDTMYYQTGLSLRYEIQKNERGVECIHYLE
ncbi:hypothetical protein [Citrobacter freundii]|uniref:hypothetical protein n=1 Tax=Citrobacter freundii TaxID=546 RepID=UPI001BCFB984|nr:hypothetical protein [Citrobacter freundii]MDT7065056.1 hypothetical protein [Citrobacter freundii]MDT7080112.1 hypothetical protein [Citrobacter freundii]MDT7105019.1 hypothetical protein [Citrobacter freundii]MDT7111960.1 hypothetical protein [Citrobacter freundii]MDT7120091.1 hypothetical protein [Citrobacter freundii]